MTAWRTTSRSRRGSRWGVRTHGPQDRFGAILYIEKEGFAELLAADRVQERWDIAVASSKGYSVRAARKLLVTLATRHRVPVLVAHDFDPGLAKAPSSSSPASPTHELPELKGSVG